MGAPCCIETLLSEEHGQQISSGGKTPVAAQCLDLIAIVVAVVLCIFALLTAQR